MIQIHFYYLNECQELARYPSPRWYGGNQTKVTRKIMPMRMSSSTQMV